MGMIRKRRGFWHYRFQFNRREYSGTTGLEAVNSNRKDAEKIATLRREEVERAEKPQGNISFVDAAGRFLVWCEQVEYRQKPNTWKRKKSAFTPLIAFFYNHPLRAITPADLERYKDWRLNELKVREISLRHELHDFRVFARYARKQGWLDEDPMTDVSIPSDRDAMREYVLTSEEEAKYFAEAAKLIDRNGRCNVYDLARLMILQGCRPEELLGLRKENVYLETGQVLIVAGKTRASRRTLDLCDESIEILRPRLEGDTPWVFPSDRKRGWHLGTPQTAHDRACRESGVSFVLYDLRHTFATRLIESGVDAPTAAAILGHNGLRTIYRYVHPSAGHKKDAMQRFQAAITRRKLKVVNG